VQLLRLWDALVEGAELEKYAGVRRSESDVSRFTELAIASSDPRYHEIMASIGFRRGSDRPDPTQSKHEGAMQTLAITVEPWLKRLRVIRAMRPTKISAA
jgi:hypothetical protein